jgi:hypothetical protein
MLNPVTPNGIKVLPQRFAASILTTTMVDKDTFLSGDLLSFVANTKLNIKAAYPDLEDMYISQVITWLPDLLTGLMIRESNKYYEELRKAREDSLLTPFQDEAPHPY